MTKDTSDCGCKSKHVPRPGSPVKGCKDPHKVKPACDHKCGEHHYHCYKTPCDHKPEKPCNPEPCFQGPNCNTVYADPDGKMPCTSERARMLVLDTIQRRIQNVVRIPSSEYAMNLASMNVCERALPSTSAPPSAPFGYSSPQSTSDRRQQHVVPGSLNVPRRRTRAIPGQTSAPGKGCDVKHFSYERYLARKKGCGALKGRTGKVTFSEIDLGEVSTSGGKYQKFGVVAGCDCRRR